MKAVSEIFNNFSTNIGTNLSVALPQPTTDFRQYFDLPILQHSKFDFHLIGVQEIIDSLKSFDQKVNMTIDNIPIKALKNIKQPCSCTSVYS